ncbi:MAG: DUF2975 domain-containing protein [Deltaproteobacteria bacterium]|nr:DUF2975 domain-containing protein [Deltaproteobacteria bacterium]
MSQCIAESPLERVQRIARRMRYIILFGIAFELSGVTALWLVEPWLLEFLLPALGLTVDKVTVTTGVRIAGYLVSLIPAAVALSMFLEALALFRAYAKGEVFSSVAVRHLRRISTRIIALAVLQPFTRTALVLVLTFRNPPGKHLLSLGFNGNDYMLAAFGGLLLAVSWVMVEAARAVDENSRFV